MANQYGHTVKDGIVYDKNGKYLGHEDIVYGGNKGGTIAPNTSEATANAQPSKTMNGGSAKIDGANPTSPSTNNATRREEYALGQNQGQGSVDYNNMLEILSNTSENNKNGIVEPTKTTTTTPNSTLDLKAKGNFDMYEPKIDDTNADATFQKAVSQLNDSIKGLGSLKLASENYQYTTGSTNVADINNLIKEIQKAYTAGVYDTATIANQLGVDQEVIRKIQQGKASELVSIGEEFAQEQLKDFFRAEEDYDINLQRTMEDYNLAKTNLDAQFNSAMQTLKRSMFDEKRAASVGSAIADRSGSEYMIQRVEKGYQQNMDDLENNYLYSSLKQRASYIRAIQDYNTNIQRLGEDFDDAVKSIQLSVLQQFQEIDNKILTAEDNLKALSKLQGSTSTAMSDAILKYIQGIEDENERQKAMQNFIAANYGYDVSELTGGGTSNVQNAYNNFMTTYKDLIAGGGKINQGRCGEPVNKYLGFLGSNLKISQANDLAPYATAKYPTQGAIAYFDGTQSRATENTKKYGHTGIVVSVDPDKGTVTLLDSNGSNKMGLGYTTYKLSDVTGYLDPTRRGTSIDGETTTEGGTTNGYDPAKAPLYESYLQGKYANIKDFIGDPKFQAESLAYQATKTPGIIDGYQQSLDTMVEFKNRYNQLSDKEKEVISVISPETIQEGGFRQNTALTDNQKNVLSLYNQIKAQLFIDGIIASKKKGAAYGNLSDAEGNRISNAQSNLNVNTPTYVNYNIDKMIRDLVEDIESLGGKADTSRGYSDPNKKSLLDMVAENVRNITNGPAIPEMSKSNFSSQGAYQANNNTGTVIKPVMNF